MKGFTIRIDPKDLLKIDRKARREAAIEHQIPHRGHQVHKTKKEYNRQQFKKQLY